ncbi:OLC1v1036550C1 [Oldenlandia corymbosa var. corymbosa]|uniref:OLC1v1036550C1 n=1 Tax=Oldenlandia corymbosa var. corymbosa TaxID=529605 RepID=A0AAV1CWH2_OLDCO|nr:OLC1v1036550C1 [Oldenlandia corymbosa var. corymbosa]
MGVLDDFALSDKENGDKGDNEKKKKKNKKKKADFRLETEECNDGGGIGSEGPDELQNENGDLAIGMGSNRIAVLLENKTAKGKTTKSKFDLGAEYRQKEGLKAFGESRALGSVEKGEESKKRKRLKDRSIHSEGEGQGHDFDDPVGKIQSTLDVRDYDELLIGTKVEAIVEDDVFMKNENKRKKKSKTRKADLSAGAGTAVTLKMDRHLNYETKGMKEKVKSFQNELKNPKGRTDKKRVSFSGKDEVFTLPEDKLIWGKWFSKEEDEMIKAAVFKYIEANCLGEKGLEMVLNCKSNPKTRKCWNEIGSALPHRPQNSVYYRAQKLFCENQRRKWTKEELDLFGSSIGNTETSGRLWLKNSGDFIIMFVMLGKE